MKGLRKLLTKHVVITCFIFGILLPCRITAQQDSDHKYSAPLSEVLDDIREKYSVRIRVDEKLIEGKVLNYAKWRYRPDLLQTLKNVLAPFDLAAKPDGTKGYKIGEYEYFRWLPEDGWKELDRIASQYNNLEECKNGIFAFGSSV